MCDASRPGPTARSPPATVRAPPADALHQPERGLDVRVVVIVSDEEHPGRLAGSSGRHEDTRVDDVRQHFHCATARFAHASGFAVGDRKQVVEAAQRVRLEAPDARQLERDVVLIRALVPEVDAAQPLDRERHQLLLREHARTMRPESSEQRLEQREFEMRDVDPALAIERRQRRHQRRVPVVRHEVRLATDRPARLREPRRRRSREAALDDPDLCELARRRRPPLRRPARA